MNARRIVEIRATIDVTPTKSVELVFHVQKIKACPGASQINPNGEGAGGGPLETPTRPPIARPTKAEYVQAFAQAGPLPECVVARREETEARLGSIARYFRATGRRMNARLDRALAWYDAADLACVYDVGRIGRIEHHFAEARRRIARHRAQLDAHAASLFARRGRPHPLTFGAVLARS